MWTCISFPGYVRGTIFLKDVHIYNLYVNYNNFVIKAKTVSNLSIIESDKSDISHIISITIIMKNLLYS